MGRQSSVTLIATEERWLQYKTRKNAKNLENLKKEEEEPRKKAPVIEDGGWEIIIDYTEK